LYPERFQRRCTDHLSYQWLYLCTNSIRLLYGELKVVREIAYSDGERAKVKCYGCDDVREGVAVMWKEGVDVSITGNSTNPTRFQHPVAGTYKKERMLAGKPYFSVASGGGQVVLFTRITWQPVRLLMA